MPIDIPEQISILKKRGLIVEDAAVALLCFSDVKLYCNMADTSVKKAVAKSFGLPQYKYLESWIRSITVLRNCCAHHARVWNRRFPWKPQLPRKLPLDWIDSSKTLPIKLYALLSTILYLEQSISVSSSVKNRLLTLLAFLPRERLKAMGFPENWREQNLWSV